MTRSTCVLAHALEGAVSDALGLMVEAGVEEASCLDLAVSDGTAVVVCRYTSGPEADAPSLHWHTGKRYHCEAGVPCLLDAEVGEHAVIVSSEAMTADAGWRVVSPNHMVVISPDRDAEIRPFVTHA